MAAKTISVSLPEAHVKLVERTAKKEKRSRSEVVRHALDVCYGNGKPVAESLQAQARWNQALVLELLRNATISAGRAAQLLGINMWDMLDLMGEHDIVMADGDADTLRRELEVLGFPGGEKP